MKTYVTQPASMQCNGLPIHFILFAFSTTLCYGMECYILLWCGMVWYGMQMPQIVTHCILERCDGGNDSFLLDFLNISYKWPNTILSSITHSVCAWMVYWEGWCSKHFKAKNFSVVSSMVQRHDMETLLSNCQTLKWRIRRQFDSRCSWFFARLPAN